MVDYLKWPDDFADTTPVTNFGDALSELLHELVDSGCVVSAEEHWSSFSISHDDRVIGLVQRGRLGYNRDYCWEVRLGSDGKPVSLGKLFGIHEYACVVITGIDSLRTVATLWLTGCDVDSLLRDVTFWDKMSTSQPLQVPTDGRAAEA